MGLCKILESKKAVRGSNAELKSATSECTAPLASLVAMILFIALLGNLPTGKANADERIPVSFLNKVLLWAYTS